MLDYKLGWMLVGLLVVGCSDDGAGNSQNDAGTGAGSGTAADGADDPGDGTAADDEAEEGSGGGGSGGSGTTAPGDSTGGGAGPDTSCEVDRDCQVINDCCSCSAVNVEVVPECGRQNCFAPLCGGITPAAVCELGTCAIEWSCNSLLVTCDAAPPECPEGQLPSTNEGCYTGSCVPAEECDVVPDCSYCSADEACIATESQLGSVLECEPMPPECAGTPSCACLPNACDPALETCVDGRSGITCTCPAC
jgi:hypothetical protein